MTVVDVVYYVCHLSPCDFMTISEKERRFRGHNVSVEKTPLESIVYNIFKYDYIIFHYHICCKFKTRAKKIRRTTDRCSYDCTLELLFLRTPVT